MPVLDNLQLENQFQLYVYIIAKHVVDDLWLAFYRSFVRQQLVITWYEKFVIFFLEHHAVVKKKKNNNNKQMSRQHTCQKDFSNHKQGIKTYCVIRFTKRYLRFFLFLLILLFSSSLILNEYIQGEYPHRIVLTVRFSEPFRSVLIQYVRNLICWIKKCSETILVCETDSIFFTRLWSVHKHMLF